MATATSSVACSSDENVSDYCALEARGLDLGALQGDGLETNDPDVVRSAFERTTSRLGAIADVAPSDLKDAFGAVRSAVDSATAVAESLDFRISGESTRVVALLESREVVTALGEIAAYDRSECGTGFEEPVSVEEAGELVASLSRKELAIALETTDLEDAKSLSIALARGDVEVNAIDREIHRRAAAAPSSFGDNKELDSLWRGCEGGEFGKCLQLYERSAVGTAYEAFGDTCGGRAAPGSEGRCAGFSP